MDNFTNWLQGHEDAQARLVSLKSNVDRALIQPVARAMEQVEPADTEADEAAQTRSDLIRALTYLSQAARNKVRHEIATRRPILSKALIQDDREAAIAQVTATAADIVTAVEAWLDAEAAQGLLADAGVRLHVGDVDIGEAAKVDDSKLVRTGRDAILSSGKSSITKDGITEVLKFGRKVGIPGLKGRWEKTLGKFAGKAAPVLQLALAAVEVGVAHYDESTDNQSRLSLALAHGQRVSDVCKQIQAEIEEGIDTQLKAHFEELVAPVDLKIEAIRRQASSLQADKLAWSEWATKLQALQF
jgi:hypothetical protein